MASEPGARENARYLIGVDLGGTNVRAGVLERDGTLVADARRPSLAGGLPEGTLDAIRLTCQDAMAKAGAATADVVAVGIGLPGIMDPATGVVFWSPNFPHWDHVDVRAGVSGPLGLPVAILNDGRCAALGELHYGAGRGTRHMIMITLGTGIGGGIFIDGRLVIGRNGSVGEVGHHTIDPNGPLCGCGNFGCWERFCGRDAIIDRAMRRLARGEASMLHDLALQATSATGDWRHAVTPALVAQAANEGDRVSLEVMEETGFYVGVGAANLINMLNPDRFVIGGGIAAAGDVLFEPIRRTVAARAVPLQLRTVRIVPAELGDAAGMLGAGVLALESQRHARRAP